MDLDGLGESRSMSMDIDDGAVPHSHPHLCDSVRVDSPGPSRWRTPPCPHSKNHQALSSIHPSVHSFSHPSLNRERLPGLDDSSRSTALMSPVSSPDLLGDVGGVYQHHGPARQHGAIPHGLRPSVQDVVSRKRKQSHHVPLAHATDHNIVLHDDAFQDGANSQSCRRVRPRLRSQQDGEFSPLLIMSPDRERDPLAEEMISVFRYPPNMTDPSHSIRRHFHLENPSELGPRILQSSSLPKVGDPQDPKESSRSDSASSFAEVALASTATRKHGRLSTLQDLWLPRPFEETKRPSLDSFKVHERGIEALPSFLSTSGGRMSGLRASCEPVGSPTDTLGHLIRTPIREHGLHVVPPQSAVLPLEPLASTTNFFDKPLCDSPDSISPSEDELTHFSLPATQVNRGACSD